MHEKLLRDKLLFMYTLYWIMGGCMIFQNYLYSQNYINISYEHYLSKDMY